MVITAFCSSSTFSQQNLFNIPSADITPKGKIFYQHQFNVYTTKLESKAHFVYGLGKGWDTGINLVGKGFYFTPDWRSLYNSDPKKGALYPVLMFTLQKSIVLNEHWQINLGNQAGVNLSGQLENKELNYFLYGLLSFKPGKQHRLKLLVGPYYTNRMYVGNGNRAGIMAGYELKLVNGWYLMGDIISGSNDAAVFVFGVTKNISKRVQVCAGYMIPNANTPKPNGIVLELNLLGWNFED
ncbi:hypothetical protein BH09BAC3_BH09BAC3_23770 [soil metagenome]